ncbi:MAG: RNA-directed DNA polymerase [Alphaproteobacteria bacterium]|nr:RNA-directed DNA polymerase [Alphaproteobacteria bacterium]
MYRKFKHSWPLFRRHLCLTARKMATGKIIREELDKGEQQAFDQAADHPYLQRVFWRRPAQGGRTLYYASLDLSKFYPMVSTDVIVRGFDLCLPGFTKDSAMRALIKRMLEFTVSTKGLSDEMMRGIEPPTEEGKFNGIPTGMMAAGFLSNVAMLPVDNAVNAAVMKRKNLAHFRFVDDHAILAYDFDVLCAWIKEYEEILTKYGIDAGIAKEKFDPKSLKDIIYPDSAKADAQMMSARRMVVMKECKIDGADPVKLMTRTLAQVSALAVADFDLLTEPDKRQRLEQLEWLLLADIPDREIRSDTRAAFAAGRIASLAPTLLDPSDALVDAKRRKGQMEAMARFEKNENKKRLSDRERAELIRLTDTVSKLSREDDDRRLADRTHYFSLLFQAFEEHPDKVRLFIRLLDYCRATGYDGLKRIAQWMNEHRRGDFLQLRRYLGALAMHVLARQLPLVARDASDRQLLHSQRDAAKKHLQHVAALDVDAFAKGRPDDFFRTDAVTALAVGLLVAGTVVDDNAKELANRLTRLAATLRGLSWDIGSAKWQQATGQRIGVWTHWAESLAWPASRTPSPVWTVAAPLHDAIENTDWCSLRRYPAYLPKSAWMAMAKKPKRLAKDDAGWLLDAATAHPKRFQQLATTSRIAVQEVGKIFATMAKSYVPLTEWVKATALMADHDPRAGEWTALEIIHQLLAPLFEFPSKIDPIDMFHPATIGIPAVWLEKPSAKEVRPDVWTWEGWRHMARSGPPVKPGSSTRQMELG